MAVRTSEIFQHLARHLGEPVLGVSPEGTILVTCPASERLLGRESAALVGRPLTDFLGDPAERVSAYIRMCARSVAPLPGALTIQETSGRAVACRAKGALLMPPPGDSMVVLRLIPKEGAQSPFALLNQKISDLTREVLNRKRAEEEALSALRAREEFLAVASHEFKTPLQSVKLQLDLIERTSRSLDAFSLRRLMPRIESMRRQVDRLTALCQGLLDLTVIKTGRMPLRLEHADVTEVVRLAVGRMEEQFQKAGCALRLDLHSMATAVIDVSKLDQILVNLFSNAAKYGAGKPIFVSVQAKGEAVTVTVRDSGIGIAPEDLSRIFGKFERAVSHENFGGLGLGLFISRQLAEAMGATLSVASTPGEGSSFILQLRTAPPVREGLAE